MVIRYRFCKPIPLSVEVMRWLISDWKILLPWTNWRDLRRDCLIIQMAETLPAASFTVTEPNKCDVCAEHISIHGRTIDNLRTHQMHEIGNFDVVGRNNAKEFCQEISYVHSDCGGAVLVLTYQILKISLIVFVFKKTFPWILNIHVLKSNTCLTRLKITHTPSYIKFGH